MHVAGNSVTATDQAVRLVGGESSGPGLTTSNTLGSVSFDRNDLLAPIACTALADAGPGAVGNQLDATCPA